MAQSPGRDVKHQGDMMAGRLDGKTAIVTGGGRGIGEGVARIFAAEGANVLIATRTLSRGDKVARAIRKAGGRAEAIATDVANADSVAEMVSEARKRLGHIDILVHNAGIFPQSPIVKMKESEWDSVLDTNLKSLFLCTKAVLPHMIRRKWGRIVAMSSITGPRVGMPGWSHYGASKGGMNGFIKAAALEVAKQGITVNGIEPGNIRNRPPGTALAKWHQKTMGPAIPMGHLGEPEDIAWAAVYLASEEGRFVTGQTIIVDGGQLLPESPAGIL